MPARERVRIRSVDLDPEDDPYETPKEVQGATRKLASRQLEHALDLHLSRRLPAGRYALLGDQGTAAAGAPRRRSRRRTSSSICGLRIRRGGSRSCGSRSQA